MINTWRGLPFYGITLLAGLQTVPIELYEAATIDGASGWHRFRYVTLPLMQPIILIVTLFSVIFTFADFQLVYVLTHGGPQNATKLFATYAFDIGMGGGQLGLGAAVALAMLPALALLIVAITLYLRKKEHDHRLRSDPAHRAGVAAGAVLSRARAVPVLLDGDHLDQTERRAVQQEHDAAAGACADAEALCRPVQHHELPAVDVEHDAGRGGLDRDLAGARDHARLPAGADQFSRRRADRDRRRGGLSGAAAAACSSRSPT